MKCKHEIRLRAVRVEFAPNVESPHIDRNRHTGERIRSVLIDASRCLDCGAWLSLGNSDEHASEQVEIEIRAAGFLACHLADDRECECYDKSHRLAHDAERVARELELIIREIDYAVTTTCVGIVRWAPSNSQCMRCGMFGQRCEYKDGEP